MIYATWKALSVRHGFWQLNLRVFCFFAALILYGCFSSPTPDHPGLIEATIAVLLIIAVGWRYPLQMVLMNLPRETNKSIAVSDSLYLKWRRVSVIVFVFGMTVPLVIGIAGGNALYTILRDMVAWLYLFIPLLAAPLFMGNKSGQYLLPWVPLVIGLAFSLRVILPGISGLDANIFDRAQPADPFYLVNAPTVLFSALFLIGVGGYGLYKHVSVRALCVSLCLFCAAVVPLVGMSAIMQRASIGYIVVAVLFLLLIALVKKPVRALPPILAVMIVLILFGGPFMALIEQLIYKTELVGLNMRLQEASAVLEKVSGQAGLGGILHAAFGGGWGATVASPAVGGVTVNFTHNLLTAMILKTGLIGAALVCCYLVPYALMLLRIVQRNPVMACALAGPFLIDVFLYASYKSLDFGLILFMIALWGTRNIRIEDLEVSRDTAV